MEGWIEFGRGPLFRLAFSLMVLGLLRVVALTISNIVEARRNSPHGVIPWKQVAKSTFGWLFPVTRLWTRRPAFSLTSFLFHVGLLLVPLFLAAHVRLWRNAVGFAWAAMPRQVSDWLTLVAIAGGLALFGTRVFGRRTRALSRGQDYFWPLLLVVPFVTGYLCTHASLAPGAYQGFMLVHIYAADLIMILIPFTKTAHCVLTPLSHLVTAAAWNFAVGGGDRVAATLGTGERPIWANQARLGAAPRLPATREVIAK